MDADIPLSLLGGLTARQFLNEYWQKKPLLVRNAFADFESPVSPDELAGMALEPDANARLIQENHPERPWHVSYSPLPEEIFSELPESHWTVLVSDCEQHWPELRQLVEPFRFIPDWRIDDLMISYAADQGTVGPHIDDYDVFLLQLNGQREWRIHNQTLQCEEFIEGLELRILSEFTPDQTWTLNPGDLLYLPPRIAHYGIGIGDACMTGSIGFRAQQQSELMHRYLEACLEQCEPGLRYTDADLQPQSEPTEITRDALQSLWLLIEQGLSMDEEEQNIWLGKILTDTRDDAEEDEQALSLKSFEQELRRGSKLQRSSFSRMSWYAGNKSIYLFANGEAYPLPGGSRNLATRICQHKPFSLADLKTEASAMLPSLHLLYRRMVLDLQ